MINTLKIAGAQLGSIWEDPIRSLKKAEPYIREAVLTRGPSLICFPEQYPTGWNPGSLLHVQDREDMIVTRFRGLAREYAIAILGSFRERSLPKPRNTCIVLDHYGEEIASYSKCHLFTPADEDKGYSPGDTPGIFRLSGIPFGIAICYDLRFSELFRVYAEGRGVWYAGTCRMACCTERSLGTFYQNTGPRTPALRDRGQHHGGKSRRYVLWQIPCCRSFGCRGYPCRSG